MENTLMMKMAVMCQELYKVNCQCQNSRENSNSITAHGHWGAHKTKQLPETALY